MDEIVKLVQQKTGISEQQARQAVETVLGFLKDRLPPAIAGQVEAVMSSSSAGDIAKGLGGMLGGKK